MIIDRPEALNLLAALRRNGITGRHDVSVVYTPQKMVIFAFSVKDKVTDNIRKICETYNYPIIINRQ